MDKIDLATKPSFFANKNVVNINSNSKPDQINSQKILDATNDDKYTMEIFTKFMGFKESYEEVQRNAEKYSQDNYGMTSLEFHKLSWQEKVRYSGSNAKWPLTGYTNYVPDIHTKGKPMDLKVSIFGKLLGYDPNFSQEQIQDLKDFINESKGLAVEQIKSLNKDQNLSNCSIGLVSNAVEQIKLLNNDPSPYNNCGIGMIRNNAFVFDEFVDDFYGEVHSTNAWVYFRFISNGEGTIALLDSDLSVEDFKAQWAKQVIKVRFGLKISDEDAKNAVEIFKELNAKEPQNQLNQTNQIADKTNLKDETQDDEEKNNKKFTPIQGFSANNSTYKDDAINRLKKIYEIIKREFDNGKTEFETLKLIAQTNVNLRV